MAKKFKIGVIGVGFIGPAHMEGIRRLGFEVVAVEWTASYPGGHTEGFPDTFKQLQTAVYRYIAAGDLDAKPDFPTFIDGHNVILVDKAILKSAKENRWVDVHYLD